MNALIRAAADLQAVCVAHRWQFCFIGGLPFEASVVDRATYFTFPTDVPLKTCSAEDLVVFKAFADRPKDWVDVEGILIRQSATLDWHYVRSQLAPLAELKEQPELVDRLDTLRRSLER